MRACVRVCVKPETQPTIERVTYMHGHASYNMKVSDPLLRVVPIQLLTSSSYDVTYSARRRRHPLLPLTSKAVNVVLQMATLLPTTMTLHWPAIESRTVTWSATWSARFMTVRMTFNEVSSRCYMGVYKTVSP